MYLRHIIYTYGGLRAILIGGIMWHSDDLIVNGIKLHYTRTGGEKPPIIMAHGVTDLGLCWSSVAEVLEKNYDVIMVDARGHGQSDAPEIGYDWITQAEDLEGVIEGLGLVKPIILGHSMGAMSALVLAGLHPQLPSAILLEDPPSLWMPTSDKPEEIAERQAGRCAWISSFKDTTREALIEKQHQESPRWSEQELGHWADSKLSVSVNVTGIFTRDATNTVDWVTVLPNITCPVLLITADPEQGAIITDEALQQLKPLLPHFKVAPIADAGHSIHRDQFDAYMQAVQAFLADL